MKTWFGFDFGLMVSKDRGQAWSYVCERAVLGSPSAALDVIDLFLERGSDGAIISGSELGLRVSRDWGCTWASDVTLPVAPSVFRTEECAEPALELTSILSELYEIIYRTRRVADILERSVLDVPELAQVYFGRIRKGLLDKLEQLIRMRSTSGAYYPHDPAVAARAILQSITFFARYRFNDPMPSGLDDALTQTTLIDMLLKSAVVRDERNAFPTNHTAATGGKNELTQRALRV